MTAATTWTRRGGGSWAWVRRPCRRRARRAGLQPARRPSPARPPAIRPRPRARAPVAAAPPRARAAAPAPHAS
eukprot:2948152-Prymnesium_polylepis.1